MRRVSELRVTELLDDLCEDMSKYSWAMRLPAPDGETDTAKLYAWQRTDRMDKAMPSELKAPEAEMKVRRRELKQYCYSLVEKHEDGLIAYLASNTKHHEGAPLLSPRSGELGVTGAASRARKRAGCYTIDSTCLAASAAHACQCPASLLGPQMLECGRLSSTAEHTASRVRLMPLICSSVREQGTSCTSHQAHMRSLAAL